MKITIRLDINRPDAADIATKVIYWYYIRQGLLVDVVFYKGGASNV